MKKFVTIIFMFCAFASLGQELKLGLPVSHSSRMLDAELQKEHGLIASISEESIKVWDYDSKKVLYSWNNEHELEWVSINPSGTRLVANNHNTILLFDLESGTLINGIDPWGLSERLRLREYFKVRFIDDSTLILTDWGQGVLLVNANTGLLIHEFSGRKFKHNLNNFSCDLRTFALSHRGYAAIYDYRDTTPKQTILYGRDDYLEKLEINLTANILVGEINNKVYLWSLQSEKLIQTFNHDADKIWSLALSPNGKRLAINTGKNLYYYNTGSGELITKHRGDFREAIGFVSEWLIYSKKLPEHCGPSEGTLYTISNDGLLDSLRVTASELFFNKHNETLLFSIGIDELCQLKRVSPTWKNESYKGYPSLFWNPDIKGDKFESFYDFVDEYESLENLISVTISTGAPEFITRKADAYFNDTIIYNSTTGDFIMRESPDLLKVKNSGIETEIPLYSFHSRSKTFVSKDLNRALIIDNGSVHRVLRDPKTTEKYPLPVGRFHKDYSLDDFGQTDSLQTIVAKVCTPCDTVFEIHPTKLWSIDFKNSTISQSVLSDMGEEFESFKAIDNGNSFLVVRVPNRLSRQKEAVIEKRSFYGKLLSQWRTYDALGITENPRNVVFSDNGKCMIGGEASAYAYGMNLFALNKENNKIENIKEGVIHVKLLSNNKLLFAKQRSSFMGSLSGGNLFMFDTENLKFTDSTKYEGYIETIEINEKDSIIYVLFQNGQIGIWHLSNGSYEVKFKDLTEQINWIAFDQKSELLLANSAISGLHIFDKDLNAKIRVTVIDNDPAKWVHIHPSGLFDASSEAMELMYWTKGLEVIEFDQLKDRYWVPGLWEKVMSSEKLPDVQDINKLKLQPEVQINGLEKGNLKLTLKKRDGGYGKVAIFINGKEVAQDIRGESIDTTKATQNLQYAIEGHPYLKAGKNEIVIKASSADGFVQGRGELFELLVEETTEKQPDFYGVVIGVGDYANDQIKLKYPKKDAEAMSISMKLGAENLFTEDHTHIYSITSPGETKPTKDNIKKVFAEISKQAKAEDVVVVYLSGHGVTWGGDEGDFYFLTSDATASSRDAYADPQIRETRSISTNEWVELINSVPALKQVMIIDACGSGKAVDNLIATRDVDGSQIKAIDRMKDRTGMYIISGSTADAVSYEASQYGQGLLTYSILQAFKGAALEEDRYVDVETIFNHATETVPSLAEGIGGIQKPQVLKPKGGSFDIGIMEAEDKKAVPLSEPKQVIIRSHLVDKKKFRDVLNISKRLNEELSLLDSEAKIIFFDTDEYAGSCQLTGGYLKTEKGIELDMNIVCGEVETFHQIAAPNIDDLINKIIEMVSK